MPPLNVVDSTSAETEETTESGPPSFIRWVQRLRSAASPFSAAAADEGVTPMHSLRSPLGHPGLFVVLCALLILVLPWGGGKWMAREGGLLSSASGPPGGAKKSELPPPALRLTGDQSKRAKEGKKPSLYTTNYASDFLGAGLITAPSVCQGASGVLSKSADRYMLCPCEARRKEFVVQLIREVTLETVVLRNSEHFSSSVRQFRLLGSRAYPTRRWVVLGTFEASHRHGSQYFHTFQSHWPVRFIKFQWTSSHGSEPWCTLTSFGVYGIDALESLSSTYAEEAPPAPSPPAPPSGEESVERETLKEPAQLMNFSEFMSLEELFDFDIDTEHSAAPPQAQPPAEPALNAKENATEELGSGLAEDRSVAMAIEEARQWREACEAAYGVELLEAESRRPPSTRLFECPKDFYALRFGVSAAMGLSGPDGCGEREVAGEGNAMEGPCRLLCDKPEEAFGDSPASSYYRRACLSALPDPLTASTDEHGQPFSPWFYPNPLEIPPPLLEDPPSYTRWVEGGTVEERRTVRWDDPQSVLEYMEAVCLEGQSWRAPLNTCGEEAIRRFPLAADSPAQAVPPPPAREEATKEETDRPSSPPSKPPPLIAALRQLARYQSLSQQQLEASSQREASAMRELNETKRMLGALSAAYQELLSQHYRESERLRHIEAKIDGERRFRDEEGAVRDGRGGGLRSLYGPLAFWMALLSLVIALLLLLMQMQTGRGTGGGRHSGPMSPASGETSFTHPFPFMTSLSRLGRPSFEASGRQHFRENSGYGLGEGSVRELGAWGSPRAPPASSTGTQSEHQTSKKKKNKRGSHFDKAGKALSSPVSPSSTLSESLASVSSVSTATVYSTNVQTYHKSSITSDVPISDGSRPSLTTVERPLPLQSKSAKGRKGRPPGSTD